MAGSGAAARWDNDPIETPAPAEGPAADAETSRTALYGGLVGDMIDEIGQRMVVPPVERAIEPEDFAHRLSVAGGYLALAAGCLVTALGISRLL